MVVRYSRARLGQISGHYHIADDVAQEVCIAVVSALPRYRDMGLLFASFVFGIASHKVADARRNAARLAIPTEDLPDGPDDRPGPEETVVAYIEAERARALLAKLPPHQRELLVLRVLTGLSAEETGHALGMSPERSGSPSTGRWPGSARWPARSGSPDHERAPARRTAHPLRDPCSPVVRILPEGPPGSMLPPSHGSRRGRGTAGSDPRGVRAWGAVVTRMGHGQFPAARR